MTKNGKLRQRVAERDGAVCSHCGREGLVSADFDTANDPDVLTIDHIDPDGGDDLSNLRLLCRLCNSEKADRTSDKTVRFQSGLLQAGWTVVPNVVLLDPGVSVNAHRIYTLLVHFARQDELCWPGQERLSAIAGISERATRDAVRELERVGLVRTRRRGRGLTNIYILLTPRASRPAGRAALELPEAAALDRRDVPPKKYQTEEVLSLDGVFPPGWDLASVDRRRVTAGEARLALGILASFNEQAGSRYRSNDYLRAIVGRIREHPELTLEEHAAIIRDALRKPWWKGEAAPNVIYGNGAVFERSLHRQRGLGNGKGEGGEDEGKSRLDRFEV